MVPRKRKSVPSSEPPKYKSILDELKAAYCSPQPAAQIGSGHVQPINSDLPDGTPEEQVKHILVKALAGTGKTFTMIIGCAWAYGSPALWERLCENLGFRPVPSPEQKVVWEQMKALGKMKEIVYCAFNKSIVVEFGMKWAWLVEDLRREGVELVFATINSLGYKTCAQNFNKAQQGNKYKTSDLISEEMGRDIRELRRTDGVMVKAVEDLVRYSKLSLLGWSKTGLCDQHGPAIKPREFCAQGIPDEHLWDLCRHYEVDLNGSHEKVFDMVRNIMQKSYDQTWKLDFDDQNWMPVVRNLPVRKFDLLLVDEAQDLNRCKQEYIMMCGKHILVVGDPNQAIYGFAGADTESMPRMQEMLGIAEPLRLTETRRCGKAIVTEANKVVPEFRAHESNPLGEIATISSKKYTEGLQDGDMVLCRVNAPLISEALRRLRQKKKAVIIGRKFGEQLVSFVKSMKATDVGDLVEKVDDWYHQEVAREQRTRNPSEAKLINLEDKKECVLAFTEGVTTVENVIGEINRIFAGKVCPLCGQHYDEEYDRCFGKGCQVDRIYDVSLGREVMAGKLLVMPEGVQYSSVHRAKGKEADTVYILFPELIPHPMARSQWAKEQEKNLWYVAVTRAIEKLVYVTK